jgi:hypothetical protein
MFRSVPKQEEDISSHNNSNDQQHGDGYHLISPALAFGRRVAIWSSLLCQPPYQRYSLRQPGSSLTVRIGRQSQKHTLLISCVMKIWRGIPPPCRFEWAESQRGLTTGSNKSASTTVIISLNLSMLLHPSPETVTRRREYPNGP